MRDTYRERIDFQELTGIDVEDSDNDKGYYPKHAVDNILKDIEYDVSDIIDILKNIEGIDKIDEAKERLDKLYNNL